MHWWWCLVAFGVTAVLRVALRETLSVPALTRTNYAGRTVVTSAGIVAVGGVLVTTAVMAAADVHAFDYAVPAVIAAVGFGLLGLFDDVVGSASARGFRGHIAAARRGRLTSGAAKLVLGLAVAAIVSATYRADGARLVDVVAIAGCANAANLLDLAPARALKVVVAVMAVLLATAAHAEELIGPALLVGAALALLPAELREEAMLGDAGANALGATVGFGAIVTAHSSTGAQWGVAAVAVGINLLGELGSFSAVIDRVPPLRVLDRLGRRK